jgi:type I restriction enzyme R subunit
MNEADTRAELIDPQLRASGWGVVEGARILREYHINMGKILTGGNREKPLIADYVLVYKNHKIAVIEAKSDETPVGEGVAMAKIYGSKMHIDYVFAANGKKIYQMSLSTGKEQDVSRFPSPDELWDMIHAQSNIWLDRFGAVPFDDVHGTKTVRYYQEIAVNNVMKAIAEGKKRILLTLATGTGKTFIAFQIAWKLFKTRWNLRGDGSRLPRILFLTDRNILADQAFNAFGSFPEDALIRIKPETVRKHDKVPTNGSIFFTIFQTFMCGLHDAPNFGEYPKDFFDFIIIDECHRGGANDESNWRDIMEYFSPAVQLGLTATPKRVFNADTYKYFGEPVYVYSLKEGINDGFLTPFKVKRIQTTMDKYIYTSDDTVVEGEVEQNKEYVEEEFNRIIEIREREAKRVQIILDDINQKEKSIIFCATQAHAAAIRDLINQKKDSTDPNYCVRVTANDGEIGEQFLREFQDNEKTIPTILTTSQKLSTGVDARNIRNIILLRPINNIIEFKQIIGRGTRLFEGKDYFTIYDFVDAYHNFLDPEWDGEPIAPEPVTPKLPKPPKDTDSTDDDGNDGHDDKETRKMLKIKLRDGKEREIQHMIQTSFWSADGRPLSSEEFLQNLFGKLPEFFKNEIELRKIWSKPSTRKALLDRLSEAGYDREKLHELQRLINAEKSDLFDVLEYVSFAIKPITRQERVSHAQGNILKGLEENQKEFLNFVLDKYIETGVEELDQEKLPDLMTLRYSAIADAARLLGGVDKIKDVFIGFQRYLYEK